MKVLDIYSKRERRAKGLGSDVFVYDELPGPLRVQIVRILQDLARMTANWDHLAAAYWAAIDTDLCREFGVLHLGPNPSASSEAAVYGEVRNGEVDRVIDVVEVAVGAFETRREEHDHQFVGATKPLIDELNFRLTGC